MFQIPVKEIIVNADSQVRLLNRADGTAFTGTTNITPTSGGFILEGFLGPVLGSQLQLLGTNTRIIKTAATSGTAEIVTFTITAASGAKAGDVYRVVTDSIDLTPVQYQNRPTEKRYQLSVDCANANAIATELAARITADPNSQVTATATTNAVTVTAKKVGVKIGVYVGQYAPLASGVSAYTVTGVLATSQAAALPIGSYDALKNINWAKNFSIDQNINWMPLPGVSYQTVYFEVNGPVNPLNGNSPIPNEIHNAARYGVRLYVKAGLTLETAIDALIADLNVA